MKMQFWSIFGIPFTGSKNNELFYFLSKIIIEFHILRETKDG
jgi:hypothetical protein